jgi:hypothetical protein
MESVDVLAMCMCIYSTSRERKRSFGFCFNPRPGSRLGKISRRASAWLDESLAWVLTEVALLRIDNKCVQLRFFALPHSSLAPPRNTPGKLFIAQPVADLFQPRVCALPFQIGERFL